DPQGEGGSPQGRGRTPAPAQEGPVAPTLPTPQTRSESMNQYRLCATMALALALLAQAGRGQTPEKVDGKKLLEALRKLKKGETDLAEKLTPLPPVDAEVIDITTVLTRNLWQYGGTSREDSYIYVYRLKKDKTVDMFFSSYADPSYGLNQILKVYVP